MFAGSPLDGFGRCIKALLDVSHAWSILGGSRVEFGFGGLMRLLEDSIGVFFWWELRRRRVCVWRFICMCSFPPGRCSMFLTARVIVYPPVIAP